MSKQSIVDMTTTTAPTLLVGPTSVAQQPPATQVDPSAANANISSNAANLNSSSSSSSSSASSTSSSSSSNSSFSSSNSSTNRASNTHNSSFLASNHQQDAQPKQCNTTNLTPAPVVQAPMNQQMQNTRQSANKLANAQQLKQPASTITVARKRGRRRQQSIPDQSNGLDRVFIWDIDGSLVRSDAIGDSSDSLEPSVLTSVTDKLSSLAKRFKELTLTYCEEHLFLGELESADQMHIDDVPSESSTTNASANQASSTTSADPPVKIKTEQEVKHYPQLQHQHQQHRLPALVHHEHQQQVGNLALSNINNLTYSNTSNSNSNGNSCIANNNLSDDLDQTIASESHLQQVEPSEFSLKRSSSSIEAEQQVVIGASADENNNQNNAESTNLIQNSNTNLYNDAAYLSHHHPMNQIETQHHHNHHHHLNQHEQSVITTSEEQNQMLYHQLDTSQHHTQAHNHHHHHHQSLTHLAPAYHYSMPEHNHHLHQNHSHDHIHSRHFQQQVHYPEQYATSQQTPSSVDNQQQQQDQPLVAAALASADHHQPEVHPSGYYSAASNQQSLVQQQSDQHERAPSTANASSYLFADNQTTLINPQQQLEGGNGEQAAYYQHNFAQHQQEPEQTNLHTLTSSSYQHLTADANTILPPLEATHYGTTLHYAPATGDHESFHQLSASTPDSGVYLSAAQSTDGSQSMALWSGADQHPHIQQHHPQHQQHLHHDNNHHHHHHPSHHHLQNPYTGVIASSQHYPASADHHFHQTLSELHQHQRPHLSQHTNHNHNHIHTHNLHQHQHQQHHMNHQHLIDLQPSQIHSHEPATLTHEDHLQISGHHSDYIQHQNMAATYNHHTQHQPQTQQHQTTNSRKSTALNLGNESSGTQQQDSTSNHQTQPNSATANTTLRTVLNNHHKQMTHRLSLRFHRIKTVYNMNRSQSFREAKGESAQQQISAQMQEILAEIDHYTLDWRKRAIDCLRMISESPNCTNIIVTKLPLVVAYGHLVCLGLSQFFEVDQVYSASKTNKEACFKRIKKRFGTANRCSYIIVGDRDDVEMAKKLNLPNWPLWHSDGHRQLFMLHKALSDRFLM